MVSGQGLGGLWTAEVLQLFAVALPGVALAVLGGHALHARLSAPAFARLVHVLIAALGALLLLR